MTLYDRAIEAARRYGYTQVEAMASERAAIFWAERGKAEFARVYYDRALDRYRAWGARAKVAALEEELRALYAGRREVRASASGRRAASERLLDVESLLKMSAALAREIRRESCFAPCSISRSATRAPSARSFWPWTAGACCPRPRERAAEDG
jgi:hypothetical protein